ncbi:hypothetical protein [Thioalkalivibrio sp. AKL10]|uniref:hypothetical protein n=1 Tax=Thioalkalivibrio sp. AKL10 TaxID=1158158 RepID=UPI001E547C5D|nr:hypothetical protein [Thioalkalivibrio sp. AKL10]
MTSEKRSLWLRQLILERVRKRRSAAPLPHEVSTSRVEVIEHHGERLHLVADPALTRELLSNAPLCPFSQAAGLEGMCDHFGLNGSLVGEFFRRSPIFLEGDFHREARKHFSRLARVAKEVLRPELDDLVEVHFRATCRADRGMGLATVGAVQFVDRVLFRLFELLLPGSEKHYPELAAHPQSLFELVHHPRRLGDTLDAMAVLLQAYHEDSEARERAWMLMSFVLMGRDPLVGGMADFLHLWRAQPETERAEWLAGMQARDVFRYTRPVNLISRVATGRLNEAELDVHPGELVVFMLMARDRAGSTCPVPRDDLAFGHGPHFCVGMPLSLEITQAWMGGLERWDKEIPWDNFRTEQPVPSVFRRYREMKRANP